MLQSIQELEALVKANPDVGNNGVLNTYDNKSYTIGNDDLEQINACIAFVKRYYTTDSKTYYKATSYGLKHEVENEGRYNGRYMYIANPNFILACRYLGIKERKQPNNPNTMYRMKPILTPAKHSDLVHNWYRS